ncbi:MAG: sigma 54-interacting transcriptional regulator, partial [Deltaproteobacteria bacterium]|nr:sigma 54-interacting transcriptional regulator [Deltaproteobacteria bacterium]
MKLKNEKSMSHGSQYDVQNYCVVVPVTLRKWESNNMLWMAGESLFQAGGIWWGKFGLEILDQAGAHAARGRHITTVTGPISFFYDNIPDLVYFYFTKKNFPDAAKHLIGLTYAMKEARKIWLFGWVGRLANTIMKMETIKDFSFLKEYSHLKDSYEEFEELSSKSPDRAKKLLRATYAREALEWMARVLAFFETSPGNALDQHISTFLDYKTDDSIEISKSLKEIDTRQDKITIWQPFLNKKDPQGINFQRSRARLLFIREFLQESVNTINSALDVKGVVRIKGSKSATLMADLVRHVRLNPMTGKVLLLGAPGGGKGLTATKYHELAIEEIKKNEPLLKETIEGIWDRLINILMLPKAQEDMGDQEAESDYKAKRLLSFVSAQLQGTTWWRWSLPRNSDEDGDPAVWPCGKTASCTKVSRHEDHNPLKVQDELCEKCPLSRLCSPCQESYLKHLIQLIPSNVASNVAIGPSVQFMAHYLARLLYAVYGLGNEARPKPKENFVPILCGVLAEQGPEFISSMRRLFGTAENVKMPMPGLFQTASYMAGTIFLDEIADAPVKVQDNLLGPLEEKEVSRLGWESIREDVGNIRIVAATHKNIKALVKLYNDTVDSPSPQGFRPDLLSRLIIFPPVYPSSVTEYFLYENKEERKINQMDFISIMLEILGQKAKEVKY